MKTHKKSVVRKALGITWFDYIVEYAPRFETWLWFYYSLAVPLCTGLMVTGMAQGKFTDALPAIGGILIMGIFPFGALWIACIGGAVRGSQRGEETHQKFYAYWTILKYLPCLRQPNEFSMVAHLNAVLAGLAGAQKYCQRHQEPNIFHGQVCALHSALIRAGFADSVEPGPYFR